MLRVFQLLLVLYPRAFRGRYGEEMRRAFQDRRRDARRRGRLPACLTTAAAIRDLTVNAAAERAAALRPWFTSIAADTRFSLRLLRRRPALSFFSALTLGLGIAAVTAVASLVDAVLIRPLPYPRPAELVAIRGSVDGRLTAISYPNLLDLDERMESLVASPFFAQSVNLTGVPQPDRVRGGFVRSTFFEITGVTPLLGRVFGSAADVLNSERSAVLTYRAWQHRFAGRSDILGTPLLLNNAPFVVVGVLPESFTFPIDDVEVFLPFWTTAAATGRGNHNYIAIGRLTPGASVDQASAQAVAAAATLEREYPAVNRQRSARVEPFKDVLTEGVTDPLRLLIAMVSIMLLTACANVAALHLGDSVARKREIAVRAALGAGRLRVARQLLIESLARALAGALLGIAGARIAVAYLVANAPAGVYGLDGATLSPVVIAVAVGAGLFAGLAAGLPPAMQWARGSELGAAGGSRHHTDHGTSRVRAFLVVSQVALAAVLLVAAGLTLRSYERLISVDVGFDPSGLLTMEYRLPRNKYATPQAQSAFHNRVLERIRALPGVIGAAGVRALPFSGNGSRTGYRVSRGGELNNTAAVNTVSAGYFETMRIPTIAGRVFAEAENDAGVIVVSRALAERAWPGGEAIGRTMYFDDGGISATVIGVVGDVRHEGLAEADPGTAYAIEHQNPGVFNSLVVRASGDPIALADDVRRAIWSVDADQPVWKVKTLESMIDSSIAARRFLLQMVAFFGAAAAALAFLGLYGVVRSAVATRTREIGVRVALGATRSSVLSLVLWTGLRLGALGIAAGLAVALAAAGLLRNVVYGIGSRDPLTFAAAGLLLLGAAAVACGMPALRALRVDPVVALRQE